MKEIKLFTNEYFFIANLLLLLSYIQTNMLLLRLVFISAYTFFIIFTLTLPELTIDSILFMIFFCLINAYLSIPLIQAQIPPNFNDEEREIFINHFKNFLNSKELEELLKIAKRKVYRVNSCLFKTGHEFSSLFFVAKLGKTAKIRLKSSTIKNMIIPQYSWMGIPEYLNIISKKSLTNALEYNDTGEWKVQANIFINSDIESSNINRGDINKTEIEDTTNETHYFDNKVILYEFELKDLDKVFSNQMNGHGIMKGLQALWLKYCSSIIRTVDINTLTFKEKLDKRKSMTLERSQSQLIFGSESPTKNITQSDNALFNIKTNNILLE